MAQLSSLRLWNCPSDCSVTKSLIKGIEKSYFRSTSVHFCEGKDLSACIAKCYTMVSRASEYLEPGLPPGPALTQESTQWVLKEELLNGQMDGLPKREPSPSRNFQGDISHNCNSLGQFFFFLSQIAGYGRIDSESHLLLTKIHAYSARQNCLDLAYSALLLPTLSPAHSLVLLTLYFILQVSAELRGQCHVLLKTGKMSINPGQRQWSTSEGCWPSPGCHLPKVKSPIGTN